MLRFDRAEIKTKHLTDEGFLDIRGVTTRTGVFKYINADGSVRRELRHPEDVLKDDALKSMKNIPITVLHPREKVVDANNSKKLSVGFTGEDVKHDGRLIDINVKVTDQKAIDIIQGGMQELSLGYQVTLIDEQGEYQGEPYDVRQTNIKCNHLAIVPRGRAGNEAKLVLDSLEETGLRLDAEDAIQYTESKKDSKHNKPKHKEKITMDLVKVSLDNGLQYDAAPEVKVALDSTVARADKAEKSLTAKTSSFEELQAKHDVLDEKVKKFEKNDNSEEIAKAVSARVSLVAAASKHLDEKELEGIEDKTDAEIKKMVILKHSPEAKVDGDDVSADYLNARFDAALETPVEKKTDDKSGISSQRKAAKGGDNKTDSEEKTVADHRNDMIEQMKNQSNPAAK